MKRKKYEKSLVFFIIKWYILNMLTFKEFEEYYNKYGKTPFQISKPKKTLNIDELQKRYKKYIKKFEYKYFIIDEELEKLKEKVYNRDGSRCRLVAILNKDEYDILLNNAWDELLNQLDLAHIFRKSTYPSLQYDINNVILLNRFSHNNLDEDRSPLDGGKISKKETKNWWMRIVGVEYYKKLLQRILE